MVNEPVEKWRIETNEHYAKIVASVISLATGTFVLPALFLREFLGIPSGKALVPYLGPAAYIAWLFLALSILCGLAYSWISVKWVKFAWGQETFLSECCLECAMDWLFVLMMVLFFGGIVASVWYFATVRVTG